MLTCKDCIGHDFCPTWDKYQKNELRRMFKKDVSDLCSDFKNKADFVEVVWCSECKYQDDCLQKVDCDYQNREIVYCSYGERKTDNEL